MVDQRPLVTQPSKLPTRKWRNATTTGAAVYLLALLDDQFFGDKMTSETEGAIIILATALVAYFTKNRKV